MKKRILIWLVPIGIIIVILIGCIISLSSGISNRDRERLEKEEYSAVFGSMYDISNFGESLFIEYRGLQTVKLESRLDSYKKLSECVELVLESKASVETIYLGIDPVLLWQKSAREEEKWIDNMQKYICSTIEQHSDITFEFMLPSPYISYWMGLDEAVLDEYLIVYQKTVDTLSQYANAVVFFPGAEKWINYNPTNYTDNALGLNEGIANHLLLATFCDRKYQVNSESMQKMVEILRTDVTEQKQAPVQYADLSDWSIVFLGDSIIGLETTTSSIPGVVNALSGAETYNCGQCGIAASTNVEAEIDLNVMIDAIVSGQIEDVLQDTNFAEGITQFWKDDIRDNKLCFVINFGVNDFFLGQKTEDLQDLYNTETYAGALRTGIKKLKDTYPDAEIVVLAPTYTEFNEQGTEKASEDGGVLVDYVTTAQKIAVEMDVLFKNNYEDMPMNEENSSEYLLDGCHLNGQARLVFAQQFIEFFDAHINDEVNE